MPPSLTVDLDLSAGRDRGQVVLHLLANDAQIPPDQITCCNRSWSVLADPITAGGTAAYASSAYAGGPADLIAALQAALDDLFTNMAALDPDTVCNDGTCTAWQVTGYGSNTGEGSGGSQTAEVWLTLIADWSPDECGALGGSLSAWALNVNYAVSDVGSGWDYLSLYKSSQPDSGYGYHLQNGVFFTVSADSGLFDVILENCSSDITTKPKDCRLEAYYRNRQPWQDGGENTMYLSQLVEWAPGKFPPLHLCVKAKAAP